jgi:ribosomal-protein-serine acetyltransferase
MQPISVDHEIELRLLGREDAPELFALTDANRAYLRQWLPWLDGVRVVADSERFIERTLLTYHESRAFTAGIWLQARLVGVIGHNRIDADNAISQVGYWIGEQLQNRGIITRSCRALIQHAFDELEINRIEICAAVGNDRSQAIPLRLGFAREGIRRDGERLYDRYVDLVVFGLTKSMWRLRSAIAE